MENGDISQRLISIKTKETKEKKETKASSGYRKNAGILLVDEAGTVWGALRRNKHKEKEVSIEEVVMSYLDRSPPSSGVVGFIAASLAQRSKWAQIQSKKLNEIVQFYLKQIKENVVSSDVLLCCALLGGGVVHLKADQTVHFIDPVV